MKASAWYKAGRQAPASPHFRGRCHSQGEDKVRALAKDVPGRMSVRRPSLLEDATANVRGWGLIFVAKVTHDMASGRHLSQKMSQLAWGAEAHFRERCHEKQGRRS